MAAEKPSQSYAPRTFKPREHVIETVMPARITDEVMLAAARDMEKLGVAPIWLVDTIATESFATSIVRLTSGTILPKLQKAGMRRVIGIIKSPGLRMAARAATLAISLDIKIVESRLEAAAHLNWPG